MSYLAIKHLHISLVALSLGFFGLRGLWMLTDSSWLKRAWVRWVPHVIDTGLLLSALALCVYLQQYPFVQAWLTAKVLGLLAYIGFGMVALRPNVPRPMKVSALICAMLSVFYILGVAIWHHPASWGMLWFATS